MSEDWGKVSAETTWKFAWTSFWYSSIANVRPLLFSLSGYQELKSSHAQYILSRWELYILTKSGGAFKQRKISAPPAAAPTIAVK